MNLDFLKKLGPKRPGWQAGAAVLFIAAGFVAIGKAWDGAAGVDFTQGQIPYLLSGGAAGIGLIMVGVALMIFELGRRNRLHMDARLDELTKAIESLNAARPVNGTRAAAKAASDGLVVAGASSYHRPDCRLVAGKEGQELVSPEEAGERGLSPCRVCSPQIAESAR